MMFNLNETKRRYERMLRREPDFFLRPDCTIFLLAERLGMNRTYTSQFVNRELKTTFHKLVRTAKLHKMEHLLMDNPDKSIKELAQVAGFKCDISFRRAYMEKYGEVPSRRLGAPSDSPKGEGTNLL